MNQRPTNVADLSSCPNSPGGGGPSPRARNEPSVNSMFEWRTPIRIPSRVRSRMDAARRGNPATSSGFRSTQVTKCVRRSRGRANRVGRCRTIGGTRKPSGHTISESDSWRKPDAANATVIPIKAGFRRVDSTRGRVSQSLTGSTKQQRRNRVLEVRMPAGPLLVH